MRRKHRKFIETLIGRKLGRYEVVHHKDSNINNGNISNLEIMSLSEHSTMHMSGRTLLKGTKQKLQKQSRLRRPGAKLSLEDILIIRAMLKDGIKQFLIGLVYGIDQKTVSDIKTGRSWAWVNGSLTN